MKHGCGFHLDKPFVKARYTCFALSASTRALSQTAKTLLLIIVRFMSHGQTLALKLLPALAVDLQPAVDAVRPAVVLKDPAHVVQHPNDYLADRWGIVGLSRGSALNVRPRWFICGLLPGSVQLRTARPGSVGRCVGIFRCRWSP